MMKFAKPVLDRIFGGSLLQIVRCSECHHESICFEPFLDLSLPIPRINRNSFEFNEGTLILFQLIIIL
jgi:ubiquitin C-terminal hydrolase